MPKGKAPKHTACRRGIKVVIKLLNGETIVDEFVERKNGIITLKKTGKYNKKSIKSFAVYKSKHKTNHSKKYEKKQI